MTAAGRTDEELRRIGDVVESELASRRPDGEPRPYATTWVVRAEHDRFGPGPVSRVTGPAAPPVTI